MNILFIWPKFPTTFWSFKSVLPFIAKKAAFPPLGLATVASLLPNDWPKKLIDLNVEKLNDQDILEADLVFISAMVVQKESVLETISRIKKLNKKIVCGGPLFTTGHEAFLEDVDYFVLGEAEETVPLFINDLKNGTPQKIYQSTSWPDIKKTPLPDWSLIKMKKYASMCIQYSRGCPFNCEFCDIVILNGRIPRAKTKDQLLGELDALYNIGWRAGIFFVDDNFIGNKATLKKEILPAIIDWQEKKKYPFAFNTQVSINLSDDEELMDLMARAGFETVFIGIETVEKEGLKECQKSQNLDRDLLDSVKIIHEHGMQVQAGFIFGFDNDSPSVFERTINFIQKSKINVAMVGLLQAMPKTRLWQRLKIEKRLVNDASGDNTDSQLNFVPIMDKKSLINEYKKVLLRVYAPKQYFQRIISFLKEYKPKSPRKIKFQIQPLFALLKSFWILGIKEKERVYFWRLLIWCLFKKPSALPRAITLAIYGLHFRRVAENQK
jgi:radical SAM superfamily enzyme YgiQ (UPF0313 family)